MILLSLFSILLHLIQAWKQHPKMRKGQRRRQEGGGREQNLLQMKKPFWVALLQMPGNGIMKQFSPFFILSFHEWNIKGLIDQIFTRAPDWVQFIQVSFWWIILFNCCRLLCCCCTVQELLNRRVEWMLIKLSNVRDKRRTIIELQIEQYDYTVRLLQLNIYFFDRRGEESRIELSWGSGRKMCKGQSSPARYFRYLTGLMNLDIN